MWFRKVKNGAAMIKNVHLRKPGICHQAKKPRRIPVPGFPQAQQPLSGFYHPIRSGELCYPIKFGYFWLNKKKGCSQSSPLLRWQLNYLWHQQQTADTPVFVRITSDSSEKLRLRRSRRRIPSNRPRLRWILVEHQ